MDDAMIWAALKPYLENPDVTLLSFDSKHLRHLAERHHSCLRCHVFDAMIADYLLNAIRPSGSLRVLCQQRLSAERADAAALFLLHQPMLHELAKLDMQSLYTDMELPLSKVLYDMEREGFLVDESILCELQTQFGTRASALAAEIYRHAGKEFNILSPKQLGEILFGELGLKGQRKTKTGYSTDADTLEALSGEHPIVPLVLEYRFITKLKSTFVDGLLSLKSADGRVRSQFNQCVTATGRISSTEPNLQNIPVRSAQGREIRKAFVASSGNLLVGADYSQIELRILAHISGDDNMIAAFHSDADFHSIAASEVFGVPLDAVSAELRGAAKAVNFGIVYGISDFGLAKNLGIPVKKAADYIRLYFARYPGVKNYLDESVASAKTNGYAVTLFGRRRMMPELTSGNFNTRSFGERVAMNMPIQGTAADIIKLAMVRVGTALEEQGLKARLILQVHDELIFDTPAMEADQVSSIVRDCMQNVITLRVPLLADVRSGRSWYETK
jgi:DNA polymerase-1